MLKELVVINGVVIFKKEAYVDKCRYGETSLNRDVFKSGVTVHTYVVGECVCSKGKLLPKKMWAVKEKCLTLTFFKYV